MKLNGKKLISRGQEQVVVYGERFRKAVYELEGEWRFFVKFGEELVEVFHKSCYFSNI